ncbi:MAG: DNA topoisomerase IB [Archangium sp.]
MTSPISLDDARDARKLGLKLVTDTTPGITRERRGSKKFVYRAPTGQLIRNPQLLQRIASLAIPPAWEQVWISPNAHGHIQATGRDAKGRKQYRYHATWRAHREATKFGRMAEFGQALHAIRLTTAKHLRARSLNREKVLATVVALLERTLIRVGNEEYARENQHYGLTTLRSKHVTIRGAHVHFEFLGKSGQKRVVDLVDRKLANIMKSMLMIPGREIFHWRDADGRKHVVDSRDVNAYLREISGQDFTAKNFRTWAATVLAASRLVALTPEPTKTALKKAVVGMVRDVACKLGNTPAVCRNSYIHPRVIDAFNERELVLAATRAHRHLEQLNDVERAVLDFLNGAPRRRVAA